MNRVIFIPIFFFLFFVILIYFLLPTLFDLKDLTEKIFHKKKLLQKKESYFFNLNEISQSLKKEEETIKKIDFVVPTQVDLPSLLNFFEKKIEESGLFLENFHIAGFLDDSAVEREKKEITISLTLKGTFHSLETFLYNIEKSIRLMELETMSLKVSSESKGESLEISLVIKTFYR